MATTELLRCAQLVVGYAGRGLLPPLDLVVRRGELWLAAGRNGSGKTTWARTVLGLLPAVSGRVVRAPGLVLAYASQRQSFDPYPPLSVADVVGLGLERRLLRGLRRAPGERERLERALAFAELSELAERSFHELSEGQKQKVAIARIHAAAPDLAVLDEPTSALDARAERDTWQALSRLRNERGTTLLVITHALALGASHADRALVFERDPPAVRFVEAGQLATSFSAVPTPP